MTTKMVAGDFFLKKKLKYLSIKEWEDICTFQHIFERFIAVISLLIFLTEGRESEVKSVVL